MADWKQKAISQSAVVGGMSDWRKRAIEQSRVFEEGPTDAEIAASDEAPALIRLEVGALDKPEDRLKALQKSYPDARPWGDGNFVFTDENGKLRQYNRESWFPGLGDIASIMPEIGETAGGAVGGILGGIGGGAVGTAVPVAGTATGAVTGAIAGAGSGSVAGRESVQRGLNWIFGNEDTRTGTEQAVDAAKTFAMGAAGEGAGRAIGAGFKAGKNAWNSKIIGGVDDAAAVQQRLADWNAIGIEPTVGQVAGMPRSATLEQALSSTRAGAEIGERINNAFKAQTDEFGRIVDTITPRPLTKAEAGEILKAQAEAAKKAAFDRSSTLYDDVAAKVTAPAQVDSTTNFLRGLIGERGAMGEFDKLTRGAQTDNVIATATAIVADAKNGMSFDALKSARTHIGQLAADTDDKVLSNRLNGLYASLTDDMERTALASGPDAKQAWLKANNQFRRTVDPETGFGKGSAADTVLKKNSDDVFNWAVGNVKNGGNRIAQVRRVVEKSEGGREAWNQVVGGYVERLGQNSAGDFDPGTFLRGWRSTSDEAKNALFKGTQNAQYRSDLDRLARIADNWTKYSKSANHSNTQSHASALKSMNPLDRDNVLTSALGMVSGLEPTSALAMGAAKGIGSRTAGRMTQNSRAALLTSPETVAWLANVPKADMAKGGMAGHMKKLSDIRKKTGNQALATAINDYFRDLNYEDNE
ncbi:hypothetical protein [Endobacterium cereale]|uniref:hypothetical protein n=1 Tax=Endobacterium cereale TaxID=2663029 RepID=UPI002B47D9F9|nr:hypothetical protein [Endobacterium cereale]MEB2843813.1 hypothetical protein [Endobacterium cereale]